jgi:hypothetical protein
VVMIMLCHACNLLESACAAYLDHSPQTPMRQRPQRRNDVCRVAPASLRFEVPPREQLPRESTDRAKKQ